MEYFLNEPNLYYKCYKSDLFYFKYIKTYMFKISNKKRISINIASLLSLGF